MNTKDILELAEPTPVDGSVGQSAMCWICGSPNTRQFRTSTIRQKVNAASVRITDSDYGQSAALSRCMGCGFVFSNPTPHPSVIDLYRDMDDQAYDESSPARRHQMRRLLDEIQTLHPPARTLLDIGAGTGLLVSEAKARGLQAEGVEPSRWCVEIAAKNNGVKLHCGALSEHADHLGKFDVVALIDVVEHTTEPLPMIREAAERLAPGGLIVIVTPDIGSFAARAMGRWWWHHRIAHVCFFDRGSMRRALDLTGIDLISQNFAGWKLPASYLCERLSVYLSFPPVESVLHRCARSRRLSNVSININLRDSRTFIGRKVR